MMISNEERREVAAKLAREAQAWSDTFPGEVCDLGDVSAVMQDLCEFAGLRGRVTCGDIFMRFAGLIDVPTAKGIIEDDGTSVCGHCGFRFDVSVEVSGCFSEVVLANHCPKCGRLLVWRDEVDE